MANEGTPLEANPFRAMTDEERDLISFLLQETHPGEHAYFRQLELATVRNDCKCGCPAFEFNIPLEAPMAAYKATKTADFDGGTPQFPINVMLWVGGGVLRSLEVTDYTGELVRPFALPALETLKAVPKNGSD